MRDLFTRNPAFGEYETLLIELHRLIARGQGDSAEADATRDKMDIPERLLSQAELDRLDGLSADLYMLSGKELPDPSSEEDEDAATVKARLQELLDKQDWVALLDALRSKSAFATVRDEYRAFLRAQAYAGLGQTDTALLFLNYALSLNPNEPAYQYHLEEAQRETSALSQNFATAKNAAIFSELEAAAK